MIEIKVKTSTPYNVVIGGGILDSLPPTTEAALGGKCRLTVVTDDNVSKLHLNRVISLYKDWNWEIEPVVFPAGEKSKSLDTYVRVLSDVAASGLKRDGAMIALGGGVVGDLGGFVAATYMRGVKVVQVPTTLLSAIDSSIGGKTGVDTPFGKNSVGCFHQPSLVLFDSELIDTLPAAQFKNGVGEGIKYAVLAGGRLFDLLESGLDKSNLDEFCALCAEYKARTVSEDEKDNGRRRLLNLGHTVGHAVELLSDFTVPHGEAVVKGLYAVVRSARRCGELPEEDYSRIVSLINAYGFDVNPGFPANDIAECLHLDKKTEGDNDISAIAVKGIGRCEVRRMTVGEFKEYINA